MLIRVGVRYLVPQAFLLAAMFAYGEGTLERGKKDSYNGPVYFAPPAPALKFTVKVRRYIFDGLEARETRLTAPGMTIVIDTPGNWTHRPDHSKSLYYTYRTYPAIAFSFTVFRRDEFMPNIESATVRGFVAGLEALHEDSIVIHNKESGFSASGGDPRASTGSIVTLPLDQPFTVVQYTLSSIDEDDNVIETRIDDHLLAIGDHIMLARYSAPPEHFEKIKREFDHLFRTMYLVDG